MGGLAFSMEADGADEQATRGGGRAGGGGAGASRGLRRTGGGSGGQCGRMGMSGWRSGNIAVVVPPPLFRVICS